MWPVWGSQTLVWKQFLFVWVLLFSTLATFCARISPGLPRKGHHGQLPVSIKTALTNSMEDMPLCQESQQKTHCHSHCLCLVYPGAQPNFKPTAMARKMHVFLGKARVICLLLESEMKSISPDCVDWDSSWKKNWVSPCRWRDGGCWARPKAQQN